MKVREALLLALLGAALSARNAPGAIRESRLADRDDRRALAEAKAATVAPALRAAPAQAGEGNGGLEAIVQRAIRERDNLWSAQFEQIHARLYEVAAQLELLATCLTALVLATLVWITSIARQVARLSSDRAGERSGGFG